MRILLGVGIPTLVLWFCWVSSLRRTPDTRTWFIVGIFYEFLAAMIGLAVSTGAHITIVGFTAALMGACTPPILVSTVVELIASEKKANSISRWRDERRRKPRLKQGKGWKVVTTAPAYGDVVAISISNGILKREIGAADPIESMNDFQDLTAKAEQAAEQYNALKITGE